jgi:hypothetical protein
MTSAMPLDLTRTRAAYLLDSVTPEQPLSDLVWGASLSRMWLRRGARRGAEIEWSLSEWRGRGRGFQRSIGISGMGEYGRGRGSLDVREALSRRGLRAGKEHEHKAGSNHIRLTAGTVASGGL